MTVEPKLMSAEELADLIRSEDDHPSWWPPSTKALLAHIAAQDQQIASLTQLAAERDKAVAQSYLDLNAANGRINALSYALRTALTGWRANHLCNVGYSDKELARIDELRKLVESEET